MITEDYCSFEISKLLKEKGFDGWCDYFYDDPRRQELRTKDGEDKYWNGHLWDDEYAAPTHQMAMKWLREKGIYLNIRIALHRMEDNVINNIHWVVDILDFSSGEWKDNDIWADTYEEAVEAALKYVLENLI